MISTFIISAVLYFIYCLFLCAGSIISVLRSKKKFSRFAGYVFLFSEILFMIVAPAIGFYRFDEYGGEIPFAKQYVLIIMLLTITSSACFWMARLTKNSSEPLLRIGISSGMLMGMVFCFITVIHFIPFIPLGFLYPILGFELLCPVIAFFFLLREFWFYNRHKLDLDELLPYRAELGFIPPGFKIWNLPLRKRMPVYCMIVLLFLVLHILLAYGFGQDIDSLFKAYTHSHGFVFSTH